MSDAIPALDAHLDDGQRALLEQTAALAATTLAPIAATGEEGAIDRPLLRALAEHGLLGRLFAREGDDWRPDVSALDLCLIREGLARGCTAAETAFALQGLGTFPLLQSGRPETVAAWLPRIAAGEAAAGFALTEPDAGSDVAALSLRAERDGDGFRLTGEKTWISNAPEADVYSVFARTTDGAGARGLTAFLVPRESEGLSGEPLRLLSPHPIGRLTFDGVYVPPEHLLGEVDGGFRVAMRTLDMFRPSVGAFAIGMANAALDAAVAHASTRQAFGGPLKDLQAVAHRLADVSARVHAARLAVHHAAAAYDRGVRPVTQASAIAKLLATEVAQEAVDAAIQVHGARALEHGHLLEHLYREVRAPRIYEGASEIQREIIARGLFPRAREERA
ncbi:acyl-CoA dehydrogenase family protein [Conexibacter woesei]|uniref:Acyl-CoA dehydrogenase domain protein n=1 Tax=Conexibacter woesei (strain DSM 14684 / CCUG 47730 / CIP 108061 / JCM 11494 / NBRC 100937 / ID131577) TaxID=469383 RepID=D3F5B8_CONWI|nr:acyl-CoA dehydrogenase family protein [Conexibacter woesei]ADB50585.1 acyl-CoA dehydrogenase domain protein [Conexibacter woesei DSM 14684]